MMLKLSRHSYAVHVSKRGIDAFSAVHSSSISLIVIRIIGTVCINQTFIYGLLEQFI